MHPAPSQSATDLVPSHKWAGLNPCCLPRESIHKEVLDAPPHPVFCWHRDLPFPKYTIVCDFDFQMNNDNEEDKKKKIHLIFSVNKIHFVLLPFSSSLLWAFTNSRICYQVLVGNSSALFTVSAGDTVTSYNLNSWHFFSVSLSFSISNLHSCLRFLDGEHMDIQTTFETNLIAYPSCARILSMCARQGVVFR